MKLDQTLFVQKLHDCGRALTITDISSFERNCGCSLPSDYKEFLILRNGGRFYEYVAAPLPTDEYSEELGLDVLYSLGEQDTESDLGHMLETHKDRVPAGAVPIGDDGDNLLLLDCNPNAVWQVCLWIRDNELTTDRDWNRVPVARSFMELAASCDTRPYYDTQEVLEPFMAVERYDAEDLARCLAEGCSPDAMNDDGLTLLTLACRVRNYAAVDLLLLHGANPNLRWLGETPLFYASLRPAKDIAKLLRQYGAH